MQNGALQHCTACGAEVAQSAKFCPHCGAKRKKIYPVVLGVIGFFMIVSILSPSDKDKPQKVATVSTPAASSQESQAPSDEPQHFLVGETAQISDIQATLLSVSQNNGSRFNSPADGNVYVLCEFEITNLSDREITISSMLDFEAYCDNYAYQENLGASIEKDNKHGLGGTVAPGKKISGVIGYELPKDWQQLEIVFTPDIWNKNKITWLATND